MDWIMNWWWVTVLGPIVLGIVMAYALMTRRPLTPAERDAQKAGVKRVYAQNPQDSERVEAKGES